MPPIILSLQSTLPKQLFGPVLLLIAEEAGVPLPVPGDMLIAYVGYEASRGYISYALAFILFLGSALLGSSLLFYLSSRFGHKLVMKVGKFLDIDEKKVTFIEDKFKKYGPWVIIVGRHVPGFRIAVTIVSGMSKVTYKVFILSTFISSCVWVVFYLWLGSKIGPKVIHLFEQHTGLISLIVIPTVLFFLYLFLRNTVKKP